MLGNTRFSNATFYVDGREVAKCQSVTIVDQYERVIHFHDGTSMNLTRLSKLMHNALIKRRNERIRRRLENLQIIQSYNRALRSWAEGVEGSVMEWIKSIHRQKG